MEANQVVHRCVARVLVQTTQRPQAINSATATTKKLLLPSRPRSLTHRPTWSTSSSSIRAFTSSSNHRSTTSGTDPQPGAAPEDTPAVPASPIEARRTLQSYIANIHNINKNHKLKQMTGERDYEKVMRAVFNADAQLGAPGIQPEHYEPILRSLKTQVEPVIQRQYGTANLESITSSLPDSASSSQPSLSSTTRKSTPSSLSSLSSIARSSSTPERPKYNVAGSIMDGLMSTLGPAEGRSAAARRLGRSSDPSQLDSDKIHQGLQNMYRPLPRPSSQNTAAAAAAGSLSSLGFDPTKSVSQVLEERDRAFGIDMSAAAPRLRLKPALGRTIDVSHNFDVTRAFRQLESACARNKVKADERKQRTHVRQGQMRKLLKMQRWRKLFKDGFIAETERVRRMWRQGW